MTNCRRGDIVLVPFDFTDRSGAKWRPAVVISGDDYNRRTPDVLVASITGNLNAVPHPGDRLLSDWQGAGLLRPSVAQTKIATVESSMLGRKLGTMLKEDMVAFEQGLREAMGL